MGSGAFPVLGLGKTTTAGALKPRPRTSLEVLEPAISALCKSLRKLCPEIDTGKKESEAVLSQPIWLIQIKRRSSVVLAAEPSTQSLPLNEEERGRGEGEEDREEELVLLGAGKMAQELKELAAPLGDPGLLHSALLWSSKTLHAQKCIHSGRRPRIKEL